MNHLPYEIIREIISFLQTDDCIVLSQTCIKMRIICLEYLTRYNKNCKLNSILKKMKKYDFYDYYILNNKENKHIGIVFKLYDLKARFNNVYKKVNV